jgi:hypothetical protein
LLSSSAAARIDAETRAAITRTIRDHLDAAASAAKGGPIWKSRNFVAALTGSAVERVTSQLDAVEGELLRIASPEYLGGEIWNLLAHVQLHLPASDPRRTRLEAIAERVAAEEYGVNPTPSDAPSRWTALHRSRGAPVEPHDRTVHRAANGTWEPSRLTESDRQAVISAVRAASSESRWKVTRLRSFRNVIVVAALMLLLVTVGTVVFAFQRPSDLPLCFTPANVVCTTSTTEVPAADRPTPTGQESVAGQAATDQIMRDTASGWDVAVVMLVGLIAAAVAAAAAVRNVRGTSTPYSLPVALAVLKLPTGALTALLGLLLMRGGFVPGLSALDSSAQIVAWALVFGYAQQLLTRLVDDQAQTVLDRTGGNAGSLATPPTAAAAAAAAAVTPGPGDARGAPTTAAR